MAKKVQPKIERQYDIVLFGATGFTGGLTAKYLAAHAPAGLEHREHRARHAEFRVVGMRRDDQSVERFEAIVAHGGSQPKVSTGICPTSG